LVSSATDNYDVNINSYNAGGIAPLDSVTLVQAVCDTGEGSATGSELGGLLIVSNPTQASETTFTYGNAQGAVGAWPINWFGVWGTAQVGEISVANRTVSPVLRVGKRTATAREVDVDFEGLYVEYVAGPPLLAQLGVEN
jgi:hypothetical protein